MSDLRELAGTLRDPFTAAFVVTLLVSLIRAPDLPSANVSFGATTASVNPSDVALMLLGLWAAGRAVSRRGLPPRALPVLCAAALFSLWLLATAASNGSSAFISGGKLVEIGALALAAVYVLDRGDRVWAVVLALMATNLAADVWAIKGFLVNGERQRSFLGAHDLAALGTMTLCICFAGLYASGRRKRLTQAAGAVGAVGITLGAALASLAGLYLAALAMAAVARARGELRLRPLVISLTVVIAITAGVLELRADSLSFLQRWFGVRKSSTPSIVVNGSLNQRLIFAYIGGRIFLTSPAFGTGWYPDLPPKEYVRFLPAAHRRFPTKPAALFPPADGTFIPQMTYDQVLYELGLVGGLLFALLLAATIRASSQSGRRRPRDDPDPFFAYLSPSWTASLLGVLAGIGLFGGATVTALIWLTIGAAAARAPET